VPPKQPVDVTETTDPAKGNPTTNIQTPNELPNTGMSGAAWLVLLMGATVAISYIIKIAVIKNSLSNK
jgi:LPXTG-motif cell wall-anchored protein